MKAIVTFFLYVTLLCWCQAAPYFCKDELLRTLPVQQGGRVKPLYVLAKESVDFIFSDYPKKEMSKLEFFCLLSLESMGIQYKMSPVKIKVDHPEVKILLKLSNSDTGVEPQNLQDMRDTLVKEMSSIKKTDSKKRELIKVIQRLDSYNDIVSGLSWTIPEEVGGQWLWTAMPQGLTETKVMAFKDPAKDLWFPFFAYFDHLKARYEASEGKKHIIEYYYSSLKPFSWNLLLGLMALGALFIFPSTKRPVLILTFLSLALQVLAIATRVYISGRAPITNMYETVAFSGFGALCMGSILWFKSKNSIYLVAGLFYNMLCMMMIQFAVSMLSPSIAPLVPSLRDNFWLSTHVTSVILSYAALALSWILANLVLMGHFTKAQFFSSYRGPATLKLMDQCMKVGVILLSTGIILGGIWADYSWGRFWGWDPKETGSLIVLLVYIAILHGRKTNLISNAQFAPITAGAFLSVMMAWFGVNYILASGLHTYGFSEGGALFLSLFTLIQLSLISFYYLKKAAAKVIP